MKNIVLLSKDEDGSIYCQQLSKTGKEYVQDTMEDHGFWDEGGTILLEELEEILDKEI
jgi:hypothetical protein